VVILLNLDQILKSSIIQKRIDFFKNACDEEVDPILLQTIKIPKNMLFLTEKLPKPNYEKLPINKNLSFSNDTERIRKRVVKKHKIEELNNENTILNNSAGNEISKIELIRNS
jgi:hypothetical protein